MNRRASSIAAKLTRLNMTVTGVALVMAAIALGAYDRSSFRQAAVRGLSSQAQIVATNSTSALVFNDPDTAEATLNALSASPNILSAEILLPDGHIFARYQRDPGEVPPGPPMTSDQVERFQFGAEDIALARRIYFQGRPAGTVALRSDIRELNSRRTQYLGIVAIVLLASMIAALVVSKVAQKAISQPIVQLADIVRSISQGKDYSVRAPDAPAASEIAVLTRAFNDMLDEIQRRDGLLHEAQEALEVRVQQRTAELEVVNKELEAFSYSVSHDLRAPLRHVTGFAGLLEEHAGAVLDDRGRKYLRTISDAARRMGQLIDDLLAFSRIGRSELTRQPVSLTQLVREARQEVTLEDHGVPRTIDWQVGDLPIVDGDPAMLRLMMINLLSNAVKYTAPRPDARIEIGVNGVSPEGVVLFVRDNGVGFDMEYANKLFGVFQRLHRSEEFEGTGIGLANVRRIVHRHGGRVWAEAAVNQGATFYFSLPHRRASA